MNDFNGWEIRANIACGHAAGNVMLMKQSKGKQWKSGYYNGNRERTLSDEVIGTKAEATAHYAALCGRPTK